LDVALKEHLVANSGPEQRVSILVLLDVALKVSDIDVRERDLLGFNPCSLGCCSERPNNPGAGVGAAWFQSLFSWMLL